MACTAYGFRQAFRQSCLAHPPPRYQETAQVVPAGAARFPLQVRTLLRQALALRDRYQQGFLSLDGLWTATAGQLTSLGGY
jgi:hypothetical protein